MLFFYRYANSVDCIGNCGTHKHTNMQRKFPFPVGETLLKRCEMGGEEKRIAQSRWLWPQDNANEIGLTLNSIDLSAARLDNILLNHLTTFADYCGDRRRMSLAVGRSGASGVNSV